VYELDINMVSGEVVDTTAIAYVDQPRIIGYYYNIDADETLSAEVETEISEDVAEVSKDAEADELPQDNTTGDKTMDSKKTTSKSKQATTETNQATTESMEGMPSHDAALNEESATDGLEKFSMSSVAGVFAVVGVVGLAVVSRNRHYSSFTAIESEDSV